MNILNLNNEIYGTKNLKQGEYANSILETIEHQEILNMNINSAIDNVNNINKEIKF